MEKIFKRISVFLSFLLIFATVLLIFAIPVYIKSDMKVDFFSSSKIADNIKNMELNLTSVIYVKNRKGEWEEYQRLHGTENRIWAGIGKAPQHLIDAFVSIEDERFFTHPGVDWKRTLGAVGNQILKYNSSSFGGSTITQQLIKNITTDDEKNASRKFREIIRALLIENKLSKNEILEAYLNTIALGNGICGVQVASNYYFNKDISELSLVECACLAAITKSPTKYNPTANPEENKKRRNVVLDKMLELEKITYEEYDEAYNSEIVIDNSQREDLEVEINSYFVDTLITQVRDDLAEKYNCNNQIATTMLYTGGYKIYSTVNPDIQSEMEKVYLDVDTYFKQTAKDEKGVSNHLQSAMTVTDYNGHILGIVGGSGEKTTSRGLNRAYDCPRQPGSTMKPIGVYALAVENNIVNYTSKVLDKPIENYYPDGKSGPKEWYGYYKGNITLDYAIRKSANTIPVRLLQELGINTSFDFLTNRLKLKHLTETDRNLASLALGGCSYGITTTESAGAYAIFGNNGVFHKPSTYYKIERQNGEVVLEHDEAGTQVISPATATIMNHLLQGVVYGSEGTGRGIAGYNSMKAYAKTGTSSESNDLWMVAGTPYYVGSVWCGFDTPSAVSNPGAAANVWKVVMKKIHEGLEKKQFTDSEDVIKKGSGYYKKDDNIDNIIYESSSSAASSSSEESPSSIASSSESSSSLVSSVSSEVSSTASNDGTLTSGESSAISSESSVSEENTSSKTDDTGHDTTP